MLEGKEDVTLINEANEGLFMLCCLNPECHNPPASNPACPNCGVPLVILQNRYRPLKSLGGGGFGKTYLAEDIGHPDPVWSLAISPDGNTLVSGSGDNTIKIWRLLV